MVKQRIPGLVALAAAAWAAAMTGGAGPLAAQDRVQAELPELVVTATRVARPADRIGSSVTVITAEQLEERQEAFVGEALRTVPGVAVSRTGAFGNLTQARIRGAEGNHTLVLIDGMEVNDLGFDSGFDFGNLLTDGIDRVEVLRGPQSTLWGGDAMGGVVNIITKRGEGPPSGSAYLEGGSFSSARASAALRGREGAAAYSLTTSRYRTHGISMAAEANGNTEADGYRNTSVLARLGVDATDWLTLEGIGRFRDSDLETDPQPFDFETFLSRPPADGDAVSEGVERQGLLKATVGSLGGRLQGILSVQRTENDRRNLDNGSMSYDSDGRKLKADLQGNLRWNPRNTVVFGIESEEEELTTTYQPKSDVESHAYFVQYLLTPLGGLDLSASMRRDEHQTFGGEDTFRGTASYSLERTGTRFKASYGTGFKAPTLVELFGFGGNPDLRPETNDGWDAGVVQDLANGRVRLEATWFDNRIENLIVFTPGGLVNLGEVEARGVEVAAAVAPAPGLDLGLSYTYTDATNKGTGREQVRNPRHRLGLDAAWRVGPRFTSTLSVNHVGEQDDLDFSRPAATRQVTLGSYTTVDLTLAYRLGDRYELYGRVENLLDEDYEEVVDYGVPGRSGFVGLRARF